MLDLITIIDNLPNAIIVVDRDRRVLLANRRAQELRLHDRLEIKAKRFGNMVGCLNADDDAAGCGFSRFCHLCQAKTMIDQAFATQISAPPFETNISTRSMGVRSLKMTVTYIGGNELLTSEQAHCIVTIEDMTEIKKKEHLVAALETIGAICHEMNQPLQALMGNLELLARFQQEAGAIAKIEKINTEMERIKSIITKLLNVTDYQTKPYLSTNILDIEKSVSN